MGGGRGHGGHNAGCVKVMMILWLKVDGLRLFFVLCPLANEKSNLS
jgi:hypothetical protein